MSKVSSKHEDQDELIDRGDFAPVDDNGKSGSKTSDEWLAEHDQNMKIPEKLNICQWVIIGILYVIFALLASFIIYISATWNTDRTNEYS